MWTPQRGAVVVGSGPNGLLAAITLARAGRSVTVLEGEAKLGGGLRSAALTLPGFVHDICATALPLGIASPGFEALPLADHGLVWVHPAAPLAHPFDDGSAVVLERSVTATARGLGVDAAAYRRLMEPMAAAALDLRHDLLGPLLRWPRHPLRLARFGALALLPAATLARALFVGQRARALFAGMAAHGMLPLERAPSAAFGLVLGMYGHAAGWPFVAGGTQRLADALVGHLRSLGGSIEAGRPVRTMEDLPDDASVLFDVTARKMLDIAGHTFPRGYRGQLSRYRYGAGVFKIDWALDRPVPWRATECLCAGTVHLGGTLDEIAAAEATVGRGAHPERPFVLLTQPSLFDPSRAPDGKHTAWAYCHVPNGSRADMTARIEAQVERFAPGFRACVIGRHVMTTGDLERHNANLIGGDINGGIPDLGQLVTRPAWRLNPYTTPNPRIYICSASTPPGGGVHGMCGLHAARAALSGGR